MMQGDLATLLGRKRNAWGLAALIALAGLLLFMTGARAEEDIRLRVASVDTTSYPAVKILATPFDSTGRPVPGLTDSNFSASVLKKSLPVTSVQSRAEAQVPISVLLVTDVSGSMAGPYMDAMREAAGLLLDSLSPVDEVGIISFADSVRVVNEFTQDINLARAGIGSLVARGNTALYEAVAEAGRAVKGKGSDRSIVLLLSDGADFGGASRVSRQDSLNAVREANVSFYVVGLGSGIDEAYLNDLAGATGGRVFIAPDSSRLKAAYAEISDLLRSQYVITLDFGSSGLGGETKMRLHANAAGKAGEVELTLHLPPIPPIPQPEPARISQPSKESGSNTLLLAFLALLLAAGAGFFGVRRFMPRSSGWPPAGAATPFDLGLGRQATPDREHRDDTPAGRLVFPDGQTLSIGNTPLVLGTSPDAAFKLPVSTSDFGVEDVRIWQANGRFIVHDLAARPRVRIRGRAVKWGYLDHGDEVEVLGMSLRFERSAATRGPAANDLSKPLPEKPGP